MKRVISCVLAISMIILASSFIIIALATNNPTFSVDNASAEKGEDVSLSIRIQNNPGIASIKLKVYFDSDLTLKTVTYNSELGGSSQQPQKILSPVTLNWYNGADNTNGDMIYATLVFTVSDTATTGNHTVSISYNEDDVFNIDEDNVAFDIQNGLVTVLDSTHEHQYQITYFDKKDGKITYTCDVCGEQQIDHFTDHINERDYEIIDMNHDGIINGKDFAYLMRNYDIE